MKLCTIGDACRDGIKADAVQMDQKKVACFRNRICDSAVTHAARRDKKLRGGLFRQADELNFSLGRFDDRMVESAVRKLVRDFEENIRKTGTPNPVRDIHRT